MTERNRSEARTVIELTMFQEMMLKNLCPRREPLPWLSWVMAWDDRFYLRLYLGEAWRIIRSQFNGR